MDLVVVPSLIQLSKMALQSWPLPKAEQSTILPNIVFVWLHVIALKFCSPATLIPNSVSSSFDHNSIIRHLSIAYNALVAVLAPLRRGLDMRLPECRM